MVDVQVVEFADVVQVSARGGTRRERGSAIGAVVRGRSVRLATVSYSETYGFQSATYAMYRVV